VIERIPENKTKRIRKFQRRAREATMPDGDSAFRTLQFRRIRRVVWCVLTLFVLLPTQQRMSERTFFRPPNTEPFGCFLMAE
jgi:hypothetical protein